ncbi:hypothetical protein GYMLUDRAFT_55738 [Collybiopsis luxurians FD-317 M1]|nr:hypothetical protein GYMLUDRAFT_55738 [Collybiopsis luxurians FD-317 M1]
MAPRRKANRAAEGQSTMEHRLPTPQGSPEKSSNQEKSSNVHGKQRVSLIGNPTPMYEFFGMILEFILLMSFIDSIVTEMARGIIVEDLQDDILKDCYSDLNPRRLRGKLLDGQDAEIQGTMLTHILDKFEEKTNEELLLQTLRRWLDFEGRAPYANLA